MTINFTSLGEPVVADRQWTEALVPRTGGGWMWISQFYQYPNATPTNWIVMRLEDGTYHIDADDPYTSGTRGRYVPSAPSHPILHQLRASNGRVFWNAVAAYWWYYDPDDEHVHDMGKVPGTLDTSLYSMVFDHDGSKIYGGCIGISNSTPPYLPSVCVFDVLATPPTAAAICRVGSNLHTQSAYAYYLWADGDWLYVLVGEEVWDVVAVNLTTQTQTIIATATSNPWAYFFEVPGKGLTVQLYTNRSAPDETLEWFWVNDGANAGPYAAGVDPPFAPHDVSQFSNPIVDPPQLDETEVPKAISWRPFGSTGAWTRNAFAPDNVAPVALDAMVTLPSLAVFGNSIEYQGYFRYDPGDGQTTYYGLPAVAQRVSEVVYAIANGKVYITGYANGPLLEYDSAAAWSATNPKSLGFYSNGVTLSGVKRAKALAYSATYNRMYMIGLRDRSGSGSGIGYYDFGTRTFAGTFANLNYYVGHLGLVVFDSHDRIVVGGEIGADPADPDPPPASAELVLYDHNLVEIERQVPVPGMQGTGRLFRTGEADVVVGLSPEGEIVYRWDIVTKTLLATASTNGAVGISYQDVDDTIVAVLGDSLCRIDPTTLMITAIGQLADPALQTLSLRGNDVYTSIDTELLVAGGNPSDYEMPADMGALELAGGGATLTVGTANTLPADTGHTTLTGGDALLVPQQIMQGHGAIFYVTGGDADLEVDSGGGGNLFVTLPPPAGGEGVGDAVDVSGMAATKTIAVAGSWPSRSVVPIVSIEINSDPAKAGTWNPVTSGQGGRIVTRGVAARWMRMAVSNNPTGIAPSVHVAAVANPNTFGEIPTPAGNGIGAHVDVSGSGAFKTIQVGGIYQGAAIVEISQTGTGDWAQGAVFQSQSPAALSVITTAQFVRVRRQGVPVIAPGRPVVNVACVTLETTPIIALSHDSTMTGDGGVEPLSVIAVDGAMRKFLINHEAVTVLAGTPVYVDAPGRFKLADASAPQTSEVAGILHATTAAGALAAVLTQGPVALEAAQWDAICGTVGGLAPGSRYYLSVVAGKMSAAAPNASGDSVVLCIHAMSVTTAVVRIQPPILL